jgi:hypothetical protein
MKSISKQLICISIILLLVGVSYTSAIRVDNKIPIVESEEDCGCNEVSDADIVRLEKQLDRLERYSKRLLVLSKDYPELWEMSKELSYKISLLKGELTDDSSYSLICDMLYQIYWELCNICEHLYSWVYSTEEYSVEYFIALTCFLSIVFPAGFVFLLGMHHLFNCWSWYGPSPPL